MSRYSNMRIVRKQDPTLTVNRAGGQAHDLDARLQLVTLLTSSFVTKQYYSSAADQTERLVTATEALVSQGDGMFAARAALYSRNEFGMRTTSHILAAEIARLVKGVEWTKEFLSSVVRRPDDGCEIVAYYLARYGKPLPNSLKRGIGNRLSQFDAYQLAKYRRSNAALSLVDLVNLTHPAHTPQLGQLIKGTLEVPQTWEVGLTQAGSDGQAKEQVWASLVREGKLGYFALLRNLRNICQQAPDVLDEALEQLTNEYRIRRSLVLPFRYYVAAKQLMADGVPNKVIGALAQALEISVANVPAFSGDTLVVVDRSSSMNDMVTTRIDKGGAQRGNLSRAEAAALFGVTMAKRNDADVIIFGNTAAYVPLNLRDSVVTLTEYVGRKLNNYGGPGWSQVGHGTNFNAALLLANKPYRRIMYFSDMQGWIGYHTPAGALHQYEQRYGAKPYIYSIDLAGYGTSQFPNDRTFTLSGFSEKLFDVMGLLEQDKDALVAAINAVELY